MVRAILDGRKTQTRRVIKPRPPAGDVIRGPERYTPCRGDSMEPGPEVYGIYGQSGEWGVTCPYGQPGDWLWVRETWGTLEAWDGVKPSELPIDLTQRTPHCEIFYHADVAHASPCKGWRPSIHMPRRAARLELEIVSVRAERLQEISEADAWAEGIERLPGHGGGDVNIATWSDGVLSHNFRNAKAAYRALWSTIHGEDSWDANPWVWVLEFKRLDELPLD